MLQKYCIVRLEVADNGGHISYADKVVDLENLGFDTLPFGVNLDDSLDGDEHEE